VVEAECQFARRTPDLLRLHKSCLSCALHVVLWRCAIHLLTRNQSQYFVSVFRLASRYIKRWRRASGRYQRTVEGEVTRSARKSYVCRKLRLGVVVFSLVLAIAGRLPSLGLMYTNIIFGVETGSCWGISSRSFLRLRIFKYCERERERRSEEASWTSHWAARLWRAARSNRGASRKRRLQGLITNCKPPTQYWWFSNNSSPSICKVLSPS
jgi:hypothetical protein